MLRRPPLLRPRPHNPGMWRPRARRASAPPSSIGGRTRAGSSGASGAAAGGPGPGQLTHVVGYRTPTAAFAGEVDTLLDPATYGSRWVSLTAESTPERDYRQRSHRVRSRRPDRLSFIGQEN